MYISAKIKEINQILVQNSIQQFTLLLPCVSSFPLGWRVLAMEASSHVIHLHKVMPLSGGGRGNQRKQVLVLSLVAQATSPRPSQVGHRLLTGDAASPGPRSPCAASRLTAALHKVTDERPGVFHPRPGSGGDF